MWRFAGLFRTQSGLQDAVERLDRVYAIERDRMRIDGRRRGVAIWPVAKLIARALRREESRGISRRFSGADDRHWHVRVVDRRDADSVRYALVGLAVSSVRRARVSRESVNFPPGRTVNWQQ